MYIYIIFTNISKTKCFMNKSEDIIHQSFTKHITIKVTAPKHWPGFHVVNWLGNFIGQLGRLIACLFFRNYFLRILSK